jgi:cell division protease FtsH
MATRSFPWLPIGMQVAGRAVGRVLSEGPGYQIVAARASKDVVLLVRGGSPTLRVVATSGLALAQLLAPVDFGKERFFAAAFSAEAAPVPVGELPFRTEFLNGGQLARLARAIARMASLDPKASWEAALFFPGSDVCVAVEPGAGEDRRSLAVRLMTGGVADPSLSPKDIARINRWITEPEVRMFLAALGLDTAASRRPVGSTKEPFRLRGRPALEAFFKEYVIDYFDRRDAYEAMKVRPPNGILLYGPPGTGKTSAVRRLADYLAWPVHMVDMGTVGSPYIHQTSVTLKRTFEAAAAQAPAILVMEEIDAMVGTRGPGSHDHKVEELSELLRQIETVGERGILVVATTNRIDTIDPAMLRRGRFDHKIEVGMPTDEEILDALGGLLSDRPTAPGMKLDGLARSLVGRNMGDVAWTVDEAARLAVKAGKSMIDEITLHQALKRLS